MDTQHTVGEDIGIKEINELPTPATFPGLRSWPRSHRFNYSGTNAGTGYCSEGSASTITTSSRRSNKPDAILRPASPSFRRTGPGVPSNYEFYPAEYGQSVGGVLVITRSGTNQLHGRGYDISATLLTRRLGRY